MRRLDFVYNLKHEQQASLSVYIGRKTAFDLWRMAVKLRNPLTDTHTFGWTCAVDSHTTCISQHNKAFLIVNHDDAHRKKKHLILRTSWETAFMSKGTTRRSIDVSCVWLALMHAEWTYSWSNVILFFVWMLAGFIIRVCLACGWPQHAVGFHYVVYSYIVFVLLLHRTWRRKQLLLVSPQVDGEGRGWSTVTSQDFVIAIFQSAIFIVNKNTFNTNLVEAWLSIRVLQQQGKGEVCLCCSGYWPYKVCSPYVSHMLPICSEVLTFNARMTTSAHMCFPYVEARPICWFVFRQMLPYVRQHMGHIQFGCFWKHSTYGPHMGCIWAAYGLPICSPYVAHMFWTQ